MDTIAAIATGLTGSGINIIRVSGDESVDIVDKVFISGSGKHLLKNMKTHTVKYGFICDLEGNLTDEVLVSLFVAPKSYTGETTVEINCHGGILVTKKILSIVISAGARLAEPGEFSKRAFLNGKMDLTKAEAVMDIISSQSDFSLKAGISQLSGRLKNKIELLRDNILHELAYIESAIDDPEHFDLSDYGEELKEKISQFIIEINNLINSFNTGRIIRSGIDTCIVGKPNVGKSSFMNLLSGSDRAIVTDIAGTTTDVISETVNIDGLCLNLYDTAGIRDTDNVIEKIGVEKSVQYINTSELIIFLMDSSTEQDEQDKSIIELIKDKKVIVLLNKSDLASIEKPDFSMFSMNTPVIPFSAKTGEGFDEFKKTVFEMFTDGNILSSEEPLICNIRHYEELNISLNALKQVLVTIDEGLPEDFYSIDLMNAYTHLGLIIGKEVEDDLVEKIFKEFCMGK